MIRYVFPPIVVLCLSLAAASAQVISIDRPGRLSHEQYNQVSKNTSLMQVGMTLDRIEYFPGEDSVLSISVKNPTAYKLEIWKPFVRETGFLMIQRKDPKATPPFGDWVDLAPREAAVPDTDSPTQFIAPGQEIRQQWLLSAASRDPFAGLHQLPARAGDYRVQYNCPPGAVADFRVVYPTVEDWRFVALQKPSEVHLVDPDGKERQAPRFLTRRVPVLLLSYQGKHVLAASRLSNQTVTETLKPGDLMTTDVVIDYFRLVETSNAIKLVDASSDAAENIVITYADDQGQSHRIKLDPNRNVVP